MDDSLKSYINSSQKIYIYSIFSIFLIIFFYVTPLNKYLMTSKVYQGIILLLLGYLAYYNLILTNNFSNKMKINLFNGQWNIIKTNLVCNYIFSLILIILFLSVIKSLFT